MWKRKRRIKQLDLNGNLIKVFDSIKEASGKTGTNCASICLCCRGKRKTSNGYKWEYDNSQERLKRCLLDNELDFL